MKGSRETERLAKEASAALNTEPEQLPALIKKFQKELEELEKSISSIKEQLK